MSPVKLRSVCLSACPAFVRMLVLAVTLLAASASVRADTIYAADGFYIDQYTSGGAGSMFGGSVDFAYGLAFDSAGNLYVANDGANNILKITPGGVSSVFATGLTNVMGLALDSAGNLYAANGGTNTIVKFTPAGVPSIFATTGPASPGPLAFDGAGNLYSANTDWTNPPDGDRYWVEKFTPAGGTGSMFADRFVNPEGLAFDGAGNLYVANYEGNTIFKITPAGVSSTFATSNLNFPWGLAFDSAGYLYCANFGGSIAKFAPDGTSSIFVSYPAIHSPTYLAIWPGLPVFVTLTAQQDGGNLVLSWPTNQVGFTLQSAPDMTPPVNWIDSTNPISTVGASFTVTNPATAGSQYFRLKR